MTLIPSAEKVKPKEDNTGLVAGTLGAVAAAGLVAGVVIYQGALVTTTAVSPIITNIVAAPVITPMAMLVYLAIVMCSIPSYCYVYTLLP